MPSKPYATLAEAIEDLERRGFDATFEVVDGRLRSSRNGRMLPPEDINIVEHHRFEGPSNPDDMSVVYALESTAGDRGLIVDAYGTYADPAIGDVLGRARSDQHF